MVIILRFQICLDVDNNRWLLATSRRPCSCSLHFSFHFIDKYYRIAPNRIFSFFHRRVPVIHLPVTRDWCGDGCGREGDAHALVWWLIILLIPTQSVNLNWLAFDYCNIKQQRCVVGGCASADECLSVSSSCKSSIVRLDPVPNTMCDIASGWWAEMGTSTEELIAPQQWDFERRPSLTTPPQDRHPLSTEHCESINRCRWVWYWFSILISGHTVGHCCCCCLLQSESHSLFHKHPDQDGE